MFKATLAKEVTVETPNTVGVAAKLTKLVSDQAKANIRAAWASGTNGSGHFSLITDSNQKVMEALKKDFPKIKEQEVLVFKAKNTMGEMAAITNQMSEADLNIEYMYTTYFDEMPAIVMSTNDNKKAFDLFND